MAFLSESTISYIMPPTEKILLIKHVRFLQLVKFYSIKGKIYF